MQFENLEIIKNIKNFKIYFLSIFIFFSISTESHSEFDMCINRNTKIISQGDPFEKDAEGKYILMTKIMTSIIF